MSFDLTAQQLESLFEFYEQNNPIGAPSRPSRHYKPGRVYGSPGEYGDKDREERYQSFISNDKLVNETFDEYIDILENSVPAPNIYDDLINKAAAGAADGANICDDYEFDNYMANQRWSSTNNYYASIYDTIRFEGEYSDDDSDCDEDEPVETMCIPPRPTEIEEGEIVEVNSSAVALDVYPNDLLEPEPFIRAPVVSYDAAVIMYEEFTENDNPSDLREWEESDWVRDHPDPMISRIYVQATDRRY